MTNPEMTTLDIGCWGCLGCASCGIGVSLLSALSEDIQQYRVNEVKYNIVVLANKGILMRIATILTPKNIDELVDIADWVHNLGIARYAISPVVSLGRANDGNKELYLNASEAKRAEEQLQKIVTKYDNFLNIITI